MDPRVRVLQGTDALDRLGPSFDDLLRGVGAPITARAPWLATCARHEPYEPLVVAVEDESGLIAVAPLAMTRRLGRAFVVGIGHGESDRACLPARDAAAAAALVDALAELIASWSRPWQLHIEQLPVGDPVAHGLSARLKDARVVAGDPCPILRLDQGRDATVYESSGLRKQVRQAGNRLRSDNRVLAVDRVTDPGAVDEALDEVARVHRARDHALGRRSALDDQNGLLFWRELVGEHARRGEVEVVRLTVDGALAAYDIGLVDPPRYTVWDHRIDVEYSRYFPGHQLARAQLDAACGREDIGILDQGRGAEPYKQLVAHEHEEREDLVAWSSRSARVVLESPTRARRWAAAFADRHSVLRRTWVWLKRHTVAR